MRIKTTKQPKKKETPLYTLYKLKLQVQVKKICNAQYIGIHMHTIIYQVVKFNQSTPNFEFKNKTYRLKLATKQK